MNAKQPFTRTFLPRSGRTLCSWEGVLPITPFAYHSLKVISLLSEDYPGGIVPSKSVPTATQLIAIAHFYFSKPDKLHYLLKLQQDFRLPSDSSKRVAMEVAEYLADHMLRVQYPSRLLVGMSDVPNYWQDECDRAFNRIKKRRLAELHISPQAFELEPEVYLKKLGLD